MKNLLKLLFPLLLVSATLTACGEGDKKGENEPCQKAEECQDTLTCDATAKKCVKKKKAKGETCAQDSECTSNKCGTTSKKCEDASPSMQPQGHTPCKADKTCADPNLTCVVINMGGTDTELCAKVCTDATASTDCTAPTPHCVGPYKKAKTPVDTVKVCSAHPSASGPKKNAGDTCNADDDCKSDFCYEHSGHGASMKFCAQTCDSGEPACGNATISGTSKTTTCSASTVSSVGGKNKKVCQPNMM